MVLKSKTSFSKATVQWSCDFPPRKTPVAQKHRKISGCLGTPLPFPNRVCTVGRSLT